MNTISIILIAIACFMAGIVFMNLKKQLSNTKLYGYVETQHTMTKAYLDNIIFVDYKIFVERFKTKRWSIEKKYKGSFFNKMYENYVHAGVWAIDGVGLLAVNQQEYEKIKEFLNTTWETLDTLGLWGIGELA